MPSPAVGLELGTSSRIEGGMMFLRLTLVAVLAAFLAGCESATVKSLQQDLKTLFQVPKGGQDLANGIKQYEDANYSEAARLLQPRQRHQAVRGRKLQRGRAPAAVEPRPGARPGRRGQGAQISRLHPLRFGPRAALPRRVPHRSQDRPFLRARPERGRPPDLGPGVPQREGPKVGPPVTEITVWNPAR